MKYFGYLLIVMLWLFILSLVHNLLLKRIWYRWLVNSILYPIHAFKLKKKTYNELININCDWILHERWFFKYWFGKRLKKIILKKIEKNLPSIIENFN